MIISILKRYHTYWPFRPKVNIVDGWVKIEIDTPTIISQESDYKKVVRLCEKRKYTEAKPILKKLIENNPSNSEFHRIMGQVLSDEGDQEEAINCLIDALRWNSKNSWALLMMGNIFAKFKNDIPTAMKYYDQALIVNPADFIGLVNIGYLLFEQNQTEEAQKYFLEALKINKHYPNAHFALGMITEKEYDLRSAFYSSIQAIKTNKNKAAFYQNSVRQAFEIAKKAIVTEVGGKIYQAYRYKFEYEGERKIDIVQDNDIPTAAKFEFAENYERS